MTTIIYTAYDCIIKGDGWQEELEKNQNLTLDTTPKHLAIYPIGRGRVSFEIDLANQASPFYRIVIKEDKTLIFLVEGIVAQNVKIYHVSADGAKCQIEVEKNRTTFVCGENKKILCLSGQIDGAKCGNFYHIVYAKLSCVGQEYLIAYNTKNFIAKAFSGQKITLTDEGFIINNTHQNYEDAKVEYVVTKAGLKVKKRDFSLLGTPPKHSVACQFLSSIKLGDLPNALSMLSPRLKENLNENSLKEYFGQISYIFPLDERTVFAISDGKNIIYTFTLSNGFIEEINDNCE